MANDLSTIAPMAKSVWIQIRVTEELKAAIETAAKRDGRTMSNWLMYVAAQQDPAIARAFGVSLNDTGPARLGIKIKHER